MKQVPDKNYNSGFTPGFVGFGFQVHKIWPYLKEFKEIKPYE